MPYRLGTSLLGCISVLILILDDSDKATYDEFVQFDISININPVSSVESIT